MPVENCNLQIRMAVPCSSLGIWNVAVCQCFVVTEWKSYAFDLQCNFDQGNDCLASDL